MEPNCTELKTKIKVQVFVQVSPETSRLCIWLFYITKVISQSVKFDKIKLSGQIGHDHLLKVI